jgi:putative phage-type endonuclease
MNEHDLTCDLPNTIVRPHGIGGSDIGAILGISPYRSAFEVWAEKVHASKQSKRDGLHLRFGHHVEPFVAGEYERATGHQTQSHCQTIFHPEHPFLYGHIDRFVLSPSQHNGLMHGQVVSTTLLECKTASVYNRHEWGEPGTDEVPPAYHAQCAWYMAITQCSRADIAVLLGNQDFRIYKIHRDLDLEAQLLDRAIDFWNNHVLTKCPPTPTATDDIRTLFPKETTDSEINADQTLLDSLVRYEQLHAHADEISTKCDAIKNEILLRMGNAEKITHNGRVVATWKATKNTLRFDSKAFGKEFPELVAKFSTPMAGTRRFVFKGLS